MSGCRHLKRGEVKQAMDAPKGRWAARDRCLIGLMCETGFRVSEILSLRVENVFLRGQVLDAVRVARRYVKGRQAARTVPLNERARELVMDWLEAMHKRLGRLRPEAFLFQSQARGNRAITRRQALNVVHSALAGLGAQRGEIGTHSLRKTFARAAYLRLRKSKESIEAAAAVCNLLDHGSVEITLRYLGIDREAGNAAVRERSLMDELED